MLTVREARREGRRAGVGAASWRFDGNTTDATYRAFLKGCEEGDPLVLDAYAPPSWLSGEWSGESMNDILGEPENARDEARQDDVAAAYEEAADRAYWRELERVALFHAR